MDKSKKEDYDKVTILDIKDSLKDYTLQELKYFVTILVDTMRNFTKKKDLLIKNLDDLKQRKLIDCASF